MNNAIVKRLLSSMVAATICLSMVACGQAENTAPKTEESKTKESVKESVTESSEVSEEIPTITIGLPERQGVNYGDDNECKLWLEEQVGCYIEWVLLPQDEAEAKTKLNLMITNGEYPDVIMMGLDKATTVQLGKDGVFIPLNDLYEKYSVNHKGFLDQNPQYYAMQNAPDGNIYGLLLTNECYHCSGVGKLWYNVEWFETLGIEQPTTTEEFKDMLMAVKNSDYNGNGEADEIPLTGSSTNRYEDVAGMILNYFLPYQQDSLVFGKDGKVVFAPFTDEFKMGMEYLIDLYNNGLIDPAAFTNDGSMLNASFTNGEHKTVFATPAMAAWWALTDDISINKKYVVMEPVASDVCPGYQEQSAFVDQASTFSWFITDKCENPEVALKLADAFFTEDFNFLAFTGPEGLAWERIENPYPSCVEGVNVEYKILAPKDEATKETIDKNKLSVNFAFSPSYLRAKQGLLDVSEDIYYSSSGLEARLFLETAKVADYFYPEYVPANLFIEDNDTRAKFNTARTSTIEYVKASITQFITGEMDLDSDWDTFVKTINGYGVDEYISIYQNAYDDYLGVQ